MGEARSGESHNFSRRLIADYVEMVLQRGVLGALEIHQLRSLVDPDLCGEERAQRQKDDNNRSFASSNSLAPGRVSLTHK